LRFVFQEKPVHVDFLLKLEFICYFYCG